MREEAPVDLMAIGAAELLVHSPLVFLPALPYSLSTFYRGQLPPINLDVSYRPTLPSSPLLGR